MNAHPRGNILINTDWVIVILYLILVGLGLMSIYAADYNDLDPNFFNLSHRAGKQLLWIGCSVVLGIIVMSVDSKFIQSLAFPAYAAVVLMQIVVILFAREVNGARAWLELGPFKLQPAEFSKSVTALALGVYLGNIGMAVKKNATTLLGIGQTSVRLLAGKSAIRFDADTLKQMIIAFGIIGVPMLMILLQNDTGTALVFLAFSFILYREGIIGNILFVGIGLALISVLTLMWDIYTMASILGAIGIIVYAGLIKNTKWAVASVGMLLFYFIIKWIVGWNDALNLYVLFAWLMINLLQNFLRLELWRKLEKLVILGSLLLCLLFSFAVNGAYNFLQKHQRERIDLLLGKIEDKRTEKKVGYQTHQSLNAIGSGGAFGKGYLQGTHTKGNWVPEQSTDYIFSTIGEEWGFMGSFVVVSLFLALILRIIYRAELQRNRAARIYGYGVACILFFHLLVNIGMTIQLMPVIGIPLPFFSYGGSSLFGFTILLFVFVKFDSQRLDML